MIEGFRIKMPGKKIREHIESLAALFDAEATRTEAALAKAKARAAQPAPDDETSLLRGYPAPLQPQRVDFESIERDIERSRQLAHRHRLIAGCVDDEVYTLNREDLQFLSLTDNSYPMHAIRNSLPGCR